MTKPTPFRFASVTHLASPWGEPVLDLQGLRERAATAPPAVLFTHVLHGRLRRPLDDPAPADDLSTWVAHALQDPETAERLEFALQPPLEGPEPVRARLCAVLDGVGARRRERRAPPGTGFTLLLTTSIHFALDDDAAPGDDVEQALAGADLATWFLYLLEEPWFADGRSSLLEHLATTGQLRLHDWLREVIETAEPLGRARARLRRRLRTRGLARKVATNTLVPEHVRQASAHDAIVRLARRAARSEDPA